MNSEQVCRLVTKKLTICVVNLVSWVLLDDVCTSPIEVPWRACDVSLCGVADTGLFLLRDNRYCVRVDAVPRRSFVRLREFNSQAHASGVKFRTLESEIIVSPEEIASDGVNSKSVWLLVLETC